MAPPLAEAIEAAAAAAGGIMDEVYKGDSELTSVEVDMGEEDDWPLASKFRYLLA